MKPVGYVVLQHAVRLDRPVKAYARWMDEIPGEYRRSVLHKEPAWSLSTHDDKHCLATAEALQESDALRAGSTQTHVQAHAR